VASARSRNTKKLRPLLHSLAVEADARTWGADAAEPISEFSHSGDGVVARFIWRGRGHGPDANIEGTCVYTLREGKIMAFEFFWDHSEALEAVGRSPQDASTGFS
jgi:ketosteroid isomerase-like protein